MSNRLLAAAERYAALGWRVLPLHGIRGGKCTCGREDCSNPGKHPRTPHGLSDATVDVATIRRWFATWPDANVGVATGAASGIVAIDIDPRHGGDESLDEMVLGHGKLPETREQLTGGGGRHILFAHPGGAVEIRNRQGDHALRPGIDVRGDGGYIVVAPSLHSSGRRYTWDGLEDSGLAPLPDWLRTELMSARRNGNGLHGQVKKPPEKISAGRRHGALVSFAGKLRRSGCNADELVSALLEFNRRKCDPPKTDVEVQKVAADIAKRYDPSAPVKEPRTLRVLGASDLWGQKMELVTWAIDGMLPRGLHICAGRPKEGKSYLSLQLALAVARGEPVFRNRGEFKAHPGRAIYFDLEGSERLAQKRLHELLPNNDRLPFLDYCFELGKLTETGAAELAGILEQTHYDLVVIDTLSACIQNGSQRSDIFRSEYAELALLRELSRKHDTCILVIHHTRKQMGGESPLDAVSGTTARTAATDGVMTLTRGTGGSRVLHVVHREAEPLDLALGFFVHGEPGWSLLGDAESVRRSTERDSILNLLIESAPAGAATGRMHPKDLAEALGKKGGTTRMLLAKMARDGEVVRHSDGSYSALLTPEQAGSPL